MATIQEIINTALRLAGDINNVSQNNNGGNGDGTGGGIPIGGGTTPGFNPVIGLTPSTNLTFTDPNNPAFNVGTGIADNGGVKQNDNTSLIGGGNPNTNPSNPNLPVPTCVRKVRRLARIREVTLANPVTIAPPEILPEFASNLRIYKCALKADIEECCEYIDSKGSKFYSNFTTVATDVTIAESEISAWYKVCADGKSIKPYYESFYRTQNIGLSMPPFMPSTVMVLWGNTCDPSKAYSSFEEYRDSYSPNGSNQIVAGGASLIEQIANYGLIPLQTYNVYEPTVSAATLDSSILVSNTTGMIGSLKQSISSNGVTNIPAVIMAGCTAEGSCITLKDKTTGGGSTNVETYGDPTLIIETRKYKRTDYQVPTNTKSNGKRVAIPGKSCQTGIAKEVQDVTVNEVQYGQYIYINGQPTGRYKLLDQFQEEFVYGTPYIIYEDIETDPNCEYELVDGQWYTEGYAQDPCLGVIRKDVYKKYKDGRQELFQKAVFVDYYRKQNSECAHDGIRIYHPFDLGNDTIMAKTRSRTKGLFNGSQSLDCLHTSSAQSTASKEYYYEITDCNNCERVPYFGIAYGHYKGSGSLYVEGEVSDTATKAVYSQYRLIALDQPDTQFTFYTNGQPTSSSDVYVINFYRDGLSDRLDPGNFELSFAKLNGAMFGNNFFTGSNVFIASSSANILTFIDNSSDTSEAISCTQDPYSSYDIVSGTLDGGIYTQANRHTYGIVYPSLGIIVLDPYKMNTELGFNTVTGSNIAGDNAMKLFKSISGSAVSGSYIKARNVKYKTTNHYFVRVAAAYANYSSNPTYVSGSDGFFRYKCFQRDPQTYITSIGLYNDFNELLAVAKLSRPVLKSFDNDVLIKIRLNW